MVAIVTELPIANENLDESCPETSPLVAAAGGVARANARHPQILDRGHDFRTVEELPPSAVVFPAAAHAAQ